MVIKIAHIDANDRVINISLGSAPPESSEPDASGIRRIMAGSAQIGDSYATGMFTAPIPAPHPLPTEQEIAAAVQLLLDAEAEARGYDSILAACSYAASTGPWQAEGFAFVDWRNEVWVGCYAILDEVRQQSRPMPMIEELIAELPALVWPA